MSDVLVRDGIVLWTDDAGVTHVVYKSGNLGPLGCVPHRLIFMDKYDPDKHGKFLTCVWCTVRRRCE